MRDFGELKKLAYAGEDFKSTSPFEYAIWMTMRHVYGMYAQGLLSEDTARKMTAKCEQDHGVLALHEGICDKWRQREKDTELLRSAFCKDPTDENKDKLLRAIMPEVYELRKEK